MKSRGKPFKTGMRKQIKVISGDKRQGLRSSREAEEWWASSYASVKLNQNRKYLGSVTNVVKKLLNEKSTRKR